MSSDQKQRILDAATTLFAERGFDGVSTRLLGRAVNLNIATINYHVGGKQELFFAVIRRLYEEESSALAELLSSATTLDSAAALAGFLDDLADAVVELAVAQPARPRLYMRRWLSPRDAITDEETRYSIASHEPLLRLLRGGQRAGWIRAGADLELFLRSFTWQLFSYFATGLIDWERWYSDPLAPEAIERLKVYMHDFTRQMLGLGES